MRKIPALATGAALLSLTLGLSACGSNFAGDSAQSAPGVGTEAAVAMDSAGGADAAMDLAGAADSASSAVTSPMMIVNGDATVVVSDPAQAVKDFQAATEKLSGLTESTWVSNTDYDRSASVSVRVPAASYDKLVAQLPNFGRVEQQNSSSTDVSAEYIDLDARAAALKVSIERLNKLLAESATTEELLQAENMLTDRQADLDSLTQQMKWLEDQVAMSTLSVTFSTEITQTGDGFSWHRAGEILSDSFTGVAYVLVIVVPWAAILIAVFLVGRALIRRKRPPKKGKNSVESTE